MQNLLSIEFYRGDTYENFQACSFLGDNGNVVVVDRSKVSGYQYKETYASRRGLSDAFFFALYSANKLDHTPVVISGRLPIFSKPVLESITSGFCIVLPENATFSVDKLWLPKADFNWRELKMGSLPVWLRDDSELLKCLEPSDPKSNLLHIVPGGH